VCSEFEVPALREPVHPTALRVLVVDDEPDLIQVSSLALVMAGASVTATTEPERALEMLVGMGRGRWLPDVLVTDLMMPGMSGVELIRRSRALGVRVPTLVISSHGAGEELLKLLRVGLDDWLSKPLHAAEFVQRVQSLAEMGRRMPWSS